MMTISTFLKMKSYTHKISAIGIDRHRMMDTCTRVYNLSYCKQMTIKAINTIKNNNKNSGLRLCF